MFIAVILAVPLTARSRWRCLAWGLAALLALAIAAIWITSLWLFAQIPGLMTNQGALEQAAISLGYRALVVPLGNRYIVPLLLAALLVARELRSAASKDRHDPSASRGPKRKSSLGRRRTA